MPLPFDKALLFIGVKHRLDPVKVLDELFTYFPFYVWDNVRPLDYIAKRLNEMIVHKSIPAGKYDLKTYVGFLKKVELMDLQEAWDMPVFQDLLCDSDTRRIIDIMAICNFRFDEILKVVKGRYTDIEDFQCQVYLDCFVHFSGMSFLQRRQFLYEFIGEAVHLNMHVKCLENRSPQFVKSVLNISLPLLDPMTIATQAAHISMMKTSEHLIGGDDQELRNFLNINMKSASLLQALGAGSTSAAEELKTALGTPSKKEPMKIMTIEELEQLKKDVPEGETSSSLCDVD